MRRGDGDLYAEIIDTTCRITKDSIAGGVGELLRMRMWQRQLLRRMFARRVDGYLKHRTELVGMPRKNGKSELGAGIAVGNMLLGPQGGEIISCAGDRDQASIIFNTAKRMVEMDPHLSGVIKTYAKVLEVPSTGTVYKAVSAEAYTKEGLNPSLVLFDELHVQPTRELWNVMQLAQGARPEPLIIGITTAGVRTDRTGLDSICYALYKHGVEVAQNIIDDPTFFMAWWEPAAGVKAPHDQPKTWRESNPGYGDLIGEADFHSVVRRTEENEFRIKRTNQWVASGKVWLPHGAWDACKAVDRYPGGPPDGMDVVIGLDGSKTGDSTALIGVTVEDRPHIFVLGIWERDPFDPNWRVPRAEVKNALREASRRWNVRENPWDDYLWQDAAVELTEEGLPIEPYPQTPERMGKATQGFYEHVTLAALTHDGDPALSRHVNDAVPKPTSQGFARIVKETPDSPRRIDGAVTAVFTLDRALWWLNNPPDEGFNIW
ncbi:terminase large subunit domain-containing protein [Promicromonospora thailandica]|uniref:Phage terminase-like protein, large subunit, contains N-terminal HTH domain n=1 Tax=Promicromonospora thailandica TaxID=765201 RepID=A0A9X2JWV9_9MICO|nr:terminase large subunit [Promicromonospora thailandica]MCP2265563.1 Phage terminase-like protein, large subunit, contains N-terminal HTH domain [Promicromonospora thailandica]